MIKRTVALVIASVFSMSAIAQTSSPDSNISPQVRQAVIGSLAEKLSTNYIYPDVAAHVSKELKEKLLAGSYDRDATASAFADHLAKDLRALGNDHHLGVSYAPSFQPPPDDTTQTKPTQAELDDERAWVDKGSAGIASVRRLPGNIGYIDLREFMPADFAAQRYASAMELVSGASGLIVDLRQNVGGDPHTVALFLSYFFAESDSRHLNDIYWRKDGMTDQFWTFPVVGPRYLGHVYVLTSPRTFSGGEECAYDFQTQKRATLVGAVTGGGANPGGPVALVHGFVANVPSGRAINPVTKTNWEHVGVKPDLVASPADALKLAYKALLSEQIQSAKTPEQKAKAEALAARVDSGDWDAADYTPINAD